MGSRALNLTQLTRDEPFDLLDHLGEMLGRDPTAPQTFVNKTTAPRSPESLPANTTAIPDGALPRFHPSAASAIESGSEAAPRCPSRCAGDSR